MEFTRTFITLVIFLCSVIAEGKVPCSKACTNQGEECVRKAYDLPICVCKECGKETKDDSGSLCGSDGYTYTSRCELDRTACLLGFRIVVMYKGRCNKDVIHVSAQHKRTQNLTTGQAGKLRCLFTKNPPMIRWTRESGASVSRSAKMKHNQLVFSAVSSSDAGVYLCTAYSARGKRTVAKIRVILEASVMADQGQSKCTKKPDIGKCLDTFTIKWYFDKAKNKCAPFIYGGCGGNSNRFSSKAKCENVCMKAKKVEKVCPVVTRPKRCPPYVDDQCAQNQDCQLGLRCCTLGCAKQCVAPVLPTKNGTCPKPSADAISCAGNIDHECDGDSDCDGDLKCCVNAKGCERACVKPAGSNQKCRTPVDLAFLIDASASIRRCDWPDVIKFAQHTADGFQISPGMTQVGAMAFSTSPLLQFRLNTLRGNKQTFEGVKELLSRIKHQNGYTFIDKALLLANQQLFTKKSGMRYAAKKVLVVLIHGRQTKTQGQTIPLATAAQALKDKRVDIWAVGIGRDVSRAELISIASDPSKIFTAASFSTMGNIVNDVIKGACKGVKGLTKCQNGYRKAVRTSSAFIPRCNSDGSYSNVQCQGEVCYCVDKAGVKQSGSEVRREAGIPSCPLAVPVTACQQAYVSAMSTPRIGEYIPRCKADGQFEEVQCQGTTAECWCVNAGGQELPGTRTRRPILCPPHVGHANMTSDCQRRYIQLLRNPIPGEYLPWCTPDGRYDWVQCYDSYCFCVNVDGDEIAGTRIYSEAGRPNCTSQGAVLTPCQRKQQMYGSRRTTPGRYIPTCKPDGRFEEVQCHPSTGACWCVDKSGKEIQGTKSLGPVQCGKPPGTPLTPCQRRYQGAQRSRINGGLSPWCAKDGSYQPMQCYGPECFCVDDMGAITEGTMVNLQQGRPDCKKQAGKKRSPCQVAAQDFTLSLVKGHTPKCKASGAFEEIQCNPLSRHCWCVDERGVEIPDTKTTGAIKCPALGAVLSPCQLEYQEKTKNWYLEGRSVPWCSPHGLYTSQQCHRSDCFCVTPQSGVEIDGSRVSIGRGDAVCDPQGGVTKCQRQSKDASSSNLPGAFNPTCKDDGNYNETQCQGPECYCVDGEGKEIKGTRKSRADDTPRCEDQVSKLTPCQLAAQASLITNTSFVPRCNASGEYEPVQCQSQECWCVDETGVEISGTRSNSTVTCPGKADPSAPCWKDYQTRSRGSGSSVEYVPRCSSDGTYNEVQCHVGRCFCVDQSGAERSGFDVNTVRNGPITCHIPDKDKTECQRKRAAALSAVSPSVFVPECTPDGSYSNVQCNRQEGGECWCVDDKGKEINETRTSGVVSCPGEQSLSCGGVFFAWFGPKIAVWSDVSVCNITGHYRDVQCDGNSGYCWCVGQNGRPSMKTAVRAIPDCKASVPLTPCEEQRQLARGLTGVAALDAYVPRCKDDGSFEEVQCTGADSSLVCWCVDKDGNEIPGTRRNGKLKDCVPRGIETECQLQVKQALARPSTRGRFMPRCKSDGKFEDVQCNEGTGECWCVDVNNGNEIKRSRATDFVSCPGLGRGMTDCQKKYQQAERDKFTVGRFMPRCTPDGRYADVQCQESTCYCVNSKGDEIYGTRVDMPARPNCTAAGKGPTMCQYQFHSANANAVPGAFVPKCHPDGGYDAVQCRRSSCYCVDKRGNEIQGTRLPSSDGRPKCDNPASELSLCQRQYQEYWKNPVPGRYVPRCNNQGGFDKVQCFGAYCFCVDEDGMEKRGTRVLQTRGTVDCSNDNRPLTPCQKELAKVLSTARRPGQVIPRCSSDGSYDPVQCNEESNECWCVNSTNSEIPGTRAKGLVACSDASLCQSNQVQDTATFTKFTPLCSGAQKGFGKLQCDFRYGYCWCSDNNGNQVALSIERGIAKCNATASAPLCRVQRMRALGHSGVAPPGAFIPQCLDDGSYERVQCDQTTQYCWCVDEKGYEIPATREIGRPDCEELKGHAIGNGNGNSKPAQAPCHQARQRALGPSGMASPGSFVPDCEADGTYKQAQCHWSTGYCWCANKYGQEQPGSRTRGKPTCSSIGNVTKCQSDRMRALAWTGRFVVGVFVPQCLPDGSYEAMQCHPSTGQCWCVDENGNELVGTRQDAQPTCKSRVGETLCQGESKSVEQALECDEDGSYSSTQCSADNGAARQCWCADRQGKEIPKTRTTGNPFCDMAAGLTECQRERQRILGWSGVASPGTFVPECKTDGRYERVQCHEMSGFCWCVDGNGNEIPRTRVQGRPVCNHKVPLSPCLLERQRGNGWSGVQNGAFVPLCADDGSYQEVQCHSGVCWCSDPHGYELPATRSSKENPNCSSVPANFTSCRKWRLRVSGFTDSSLPSKVFIPACEADGSFKEVQCTIDTGYCWCVDANGNMIAGTKTRGIPNCQNKAGPTKCQQEKVAARAASSFTPECRSDGSYAPEQCNQRTDECWCVDELGAEEDGTRVLGVSALCSPSAHLTPCQKELRRALGYVGKAAKGRFVPECKPDGNYNDVQCHTSGYCWCVDQEGTEVLGTRTMGKPLCYASAIRSKCQGDRQLALGSNPTPAKGTFVPKCRPDGSFEEVQCDRHVGECWCVDKNGKELPRTRQIGVPLYCSVDDFSHCVRERQRSLAWTGVNVPDLFTPECRPDGSYETVQCHAKSGTCWCVDRWGHEVVGSRVKGIPDCSSLVVPISSCTEDQQRALIWSEQYDSIYGIFSPDCKDDGSYNEVQCHSQTGYCWCVDKHGNEIWGTRSQEPPQDCKTLDDNTTQCTKESQEGRRFQQADNMLSRFVPDCDPQGSYNPVQCDGLGYCWCVDKYGLELPRTKVHGLPQSCGMFAGTTACQRERYLSMSLNGSPPPGRFAAACEPDGSYSPVQCDNSSRICWCVDQNGLEIPRTQSKTRPNCRVDETNLSKCQKERYRTLPWTAQFTPECNKDGSYKTQQCDNGQCWCVDRYGNEIQGTRSDKRFTCPDEFPEDSSTTCQAKRQEVLRDGVLGNGFVPSCDEVGGYRPVQCLPGSPYCWCVDNYGQEIPRTKTKGTPQCGMLAGLSICQKERQIVIGWTGVAAPGAFVPKCKPSGEYDTVQCHGSTGLCWCVSKDGNEIRGTRTRGRPMCVVFDGLTPCQKERQRGLGVLGTPPPGRYVPQCTPKGDYGPTQCHDSTGYCWCVDREGRELPNTRRKGKTFCEEGDELGLCNVDYLWTMALSYRDVYYPSCLPDGTYKPVQCNYAWGRQCWCVDGNGNKVTNTTTAGSPNCSSVSQGSSVTQCQSERREALITATARKPRSFIPQCTEDGAYDPVQCQVTSGECWCVTRRGLELPETRTRGKPSCDVPMCMQERMNGLGYRSMPGRFVPKCTVGGQYQSMQCHYSSGYCWCVDELGREIPNTRIQGKPICSVKGGSMTTCQRQRKAALLSLVPGQLIVRCKPDGSFDSTQCQDTICYCVDANGVEILGTRVNLPEKPACNLGRPAQRKSGLLNTKCMMDYRNAMLNFAINRFVPQCKPDGQFADVQCSDGWYWCWCVDKSGQEIPTTRTRGWPKCPNTDPSPKGLTQCQGEYREALQSYIYGRYVPRCKPDGEYEPVQCHSSLCFCVNKFGVKIAGTRRPGLSPPNCKSSAEGPTKCQKLYKDRRMGYPKGVFVPRCTTDGGYADVQCDQARYCWCVDRDGQEKPRTRAYGWPKCATKAQDPATRCHKEFKAAHRNPADACAPLCQPNGGHDPMQCRAGDCYCVDETGKEIAGTATALPLIPNCVAAGRMLSPCQRQYELAIQRHVLSRWIPRCRADGTYEPVQCDRGWFCWCTDEDGKELPGTRKRGWPNCGVRVKKLTRCQSLHMLALQQLVPGRFIPRCKGDGSFDPVQCFGSVCLCVDRYGVEIPETSKSRFMEPNCAPLGWTLTPCQRHYQRAHKQSTMGHFLPRCLADGSYASVQYHGTLSFCVDSEGIEILRTRRKLPEKPKCSKAARKKKTRCLKYLKEARKSSDPRTSIPRCLADGSYHPVQCRGMKCYCVDSKGTPIKKTSTPRPLRPDCNGPLPKQCQQEHSSSLKSYQPGRHIPRCTLEGQYQPIQTRGSYTYCVDVKGREVSGTRNPMPFNPKCIYLDKHGFEVRPGSCPVTWELRNASSCSTTTDQCSYDVECSGSYKCCFSGCRNVCVSPQTDGPCDRVIDLAILVDTSLGRDRCGWAEILPYLETLTNRFLVSHEAVHIAIIAYGENPKMEIAFNSLKRRFITGEEIDRVIDQIRWTGGQSNTTKALDMANKVLFEPRGGIRPDSSKVVLVVTNEKDVTSESLVKKSPSLRNKGVRLYTVSVGDGPVRRVYLSPKKAFAPNPLWLMDQSAKPLADAICAATDCKAQFDIGFLVDASDSVGRIAWERTKQFIIGLLKAFKIGERSVKVAAAVYSNHPKTVMNFNTLTGNALTSARVNSLIGDMKWLKGYTFTDKALKLANDIMFTSANGMRDNVAKVLLIMTDGRQTRNIGPFLEPDVFAKRLKAKGVTILAVGIGNSIDQAELERVASSPQMVFYSESFDALQRVSEKVKKAVCKTTQMKNGTCPQKWKGVKGSSCPSRQDLCSSDQDCFGILMCCDSGCGFECVETTQVLSIPPYADCETDKLTGLISCSCPECGDEVDPVCSSDNKTYSSECQLRRAACLKNNMITMRRKGDCDPCKNHTCTLPPYSTCTAINDKPRCRCPTGCRSTDLKESKQVCGSNNRTYDSECLMQLDACNTNTSIIVQLNSTCPVPCKGKSDIAFLVDSSGSIGRINWKRIKTFLIAVLQDFDISENETRIAIISYSTDPKLIMKFNTLTGRDLNIKNVESYIRPMPLQRGFTFIDKGLKMADNEVFTAAGGMRGSDIPKVLMVFTDGKQTTDRGNYVEPDIAVRGLLKKGIAIYSLGIGSSVDVTELEEIASHPLKAILAPSFKVLHELTDTIKDALCKVALVKDGQCPANWKGVNGTTCDDRADSCARDSECDGPFKCCDSGCFKDCAKPNQVFAMAPYAICEVTKNTGKVECVCPECPSDRNPVCGSDGKTYINECRMRQEACQDEKWIKVAPKQVCDPCNKFDCSSPPYSSCSLKDGKPTCTCPTCPKTKKPVCGSYNQTYDSECLLRADACATNKVILVKSNGPCPVPCKGVGDIAFLVDSSDSIGLENWEKMKEFVVSILKEFDISEQGSRVAVIIYSTNARVVLRLNTFKGKDISIERVTEVVQPIEWQRGFSFIDRALTMANQEIFTVEGGMRSDARKVLVALTDGKQTRDQGPYVPLYKASRAVRKKGVEVFAIGIGDQFTEEELREIASDEKNVLMKRSFDQPPDPVNVAEKIKEALCKETLRKDGECPVNWKGINGTACDGRNDTCSTDIDCIGNFKCCDSGCFKQCVLPNQVFDMPRFSVCEAPLKSGKISCVCPECPPDGGEPVCTTDNQRFPDECSMQQEACWNNVMFDLKPCDPCEDVVCTSPPYSSCEAMNGKAVCACPKMCPMDVDPVCGTDDNTYDNVCLMERQACNSNKTITVRRKGDCDPCKDFSCDSPPYSTCKAIDDKPNCVCPRACPYNPDPVCGSDGNTYDNECLMRLQACKSNKSITVRRKGDCDPCKNFDCTSPPYSSCEPQDDKPVCVCPKVCPEPVDPVCGSDNTTYDNECLLRQQACKTNIMITVRRKGDCDPCKDFDCTTPPYSSCEAQNDKPVCVCPKVCPVSVDPVCGSDNNTYDNECLLRQQACKMNKPITVRRKGDCDPCKGFDCTSPPYSSCEAQNDKAVCVCPKVCPEPVDPVCGSDNNTYDNECLLRQQACKMNKPITVRRKGDCDPCKGFDCNIPPYSSCQAQNDKPVCVCPKVCPEPVDPVCGSDNNTYDNECLLRQQACKTNKPITVRRKGDCDPCKDFDCTIPPYSSCEAQNDKPMCVCPKVCPASVDPVCGSDNNTYDNACLLRQQACKTNKPITVRRKGDCDPCKGFDCTSPPYSSCEAQNDKPVCVCPKICPAFVDLVCGSDNNTYNNECQLRQQACKMNKPISVRRKGDCDPCKDFDCTSPPYSSCEAQNDKPVCVCPKVCPLSVDPVCGSDNSTYDNECLLRQQACKTNKLITLRRKGDCDRCKDFDCSSPPYSSCEAQNDKAMCVCSRVCPEPVDAVCGSDNNTYDNECLLRQQSCNMNNLITVRRKGDCDFCEGVDCSSIPYSSCQNVNNKPVCVCPTVCPVNLDPVCSSDGNTYDNECVMQQQACKARKGVTVRRKGHCDPCKNFVCEAPHAKCVAFNDQRICMCPGCPRTSKSVCGSDSKTYSNECRLRQRACTTNQQITVKWKGTCDPCKNFDCTSPPYSSCEAQNDKPVCVCPKICPASVDPVCGTDNNTYNNECQLRQQACKMNKPISVRRKGDCDPCKDFDCTSPPYSSCEAQNDKPVCVCPKVCPASVDPVCGSDNNTYNNECQLRQQACQTNKPNTVRRKGDCDPCKDFNCVTPPYSTCKAVDDKPNCVCPITCKDTLDPVCGSDSNTYNSECLMRQQACKTNKTITVRRKGYCDPCKNFDCTSPPYSSCEAQNDKVVCVCPKVCPASVDHVCGSDNNTYDNDCLLRQQACKTNTMVTVRRKGDCDPCKDFSCDSPPYSTCKALDDKPNCVCPRACPKILDPVCGSDNNTYNNECLMKRQACKTNTMITVRRKGYCDPCTNFNCDVPYSTCQAINDKAVCVCPKCPKPTDPVCASNNKTYDSECLMLQDACKKNKALTVAHKRLCPVECDIAADVAFLVDSSGSIGRRNWKLTKIFIKEVISEFNISEGGVHVGLISYSTEAEVAFDFRVLTGRELNRARLKNLIGEMRWQRGLTFIDKALLLADKALFSVEKGMRPEVAKIALVITDGKQTKNRGNHTHLSKASRYIKKKGVVVYALGIGMNVDVGELEDIASDPRKVIIADSFAKLANVVGSMKKYLCEGGTVRDGSCPAPWKFSNYSDCITKPSTCVVDSDCPENRKCCHSGCNKECALSDQAYQRRPFSLCQVSNVTGHVVCDCPTCPGTDYPVCATNNVTYSSECQMQNAACRTNTWILVRKMGYCDPCQNYSCASRPYSQCEDVNGSAACVCPTSCSKTLDPVCGSDLESYDNVCYLRMKSCQENTFISVLRPNYCDPCKDFDCTAPYSSCVVDENDNPVCACPNNCPKDKAPVCGSNWKNYPNECMMRQDACLSDKMITVRSKGMCDPCARYDCQAKFPYSTCKPKGASDRECICPTCPRGNKPICASNNRTYTSKCNLRRASCLMGTYLTVKHQGECVCEATVDLGFLVDSSGSIGRRNWRLMKLFINHIVDEFKISADRSHVAVIEYSTNPSLVFDFNELRGAAITADNYKILIDRMRWQRGYTFIDKALVLANKRMFTVENGMRPNVAKVLIVLTDGQQSKFTTYTPLHIASRPLKEKGVRIYAIGIGSAVNKRELHQIATHHKRDVLVASSFKTLQNKTKDIIDNVCFPDPCDSYLCTKPYAECIVMDSIPFCQCPVECTNETKPVCASDGVTYQNECLMQKRACARNENLNVTADKPCPCNEPVDLALLVDSSGSIGRRNFKNMMSFIKDVISNFQPSEQGTHVAMVSYSTNARVDFKFNTLTGSNINNKTYSDMISKVRWQRGYTFIDRALELANRELFTEEAGMRRNVHKVMLLLTDGYQTRNQGQYTPLDRAILPIKVKGFRVYTLGIGLNLNRAELEVLASNPVKDVFIATSFDALEEKIKDIVYQVCYKAQDPCKSVKCSKPWSFCKVVGDVPKCVCPPSCPKSLKPVCGSDGITYESECMLIRESCERNKTLNVADQKACVCKTKVDIAFIVDSSGSIGRKNWKRMRDFIRRIISNFQVYNGGTHVAAIAYSTEAIVEFTFGTVRGPEISHEKYGKMIDNMRYQRGYTFIDKGLDLANKVIFTPEAGMRLDVPKVAVVLTDGYQTKKLGHYTPLAEASRPLKEKGVHVYAFGIGRNTNTDELLEIASHGRKDVFQAVSFADLENHVDDIVNSVCLRQSSSDGNISWHG